MRRTRYAASCITVVALFFATYAMSMNIVDASFDDNTDELVFTVLYRGTHPNHVFSIRWEECRRMSDGHLEILGIVQDSDPKDPAQKDFEKIERISMTDFSCRPAVVTIGAPSPVYRRSVKIPALKRN